MPNVLKMKPLAVWTFGTALLLERRSASSKPLYYLRAFTPGKLRSPGVIEIRPLRGRAASERNIALSTTHQSVDTRNRVSTNHLQSAITHQSVETRLIASLQPLSINHQPPTTNYPPSTTNHQPPTINHQLSSINHQPPTTNHQPPTINPQPPTINHHPRHAKRPLLGCETALTGLRNGLNRSVVRAVLQAVGCQGLARAWQNAIV